MSKRLLLSAALAGLIMTAVELRAADVEVQLYPLSGDVRLFNPNATDFGFVFYELDSEANAFPGAPAGWTSIADTYDASGNGFIDPVNEWTELPTTDSQVAEGLFVGSGSSLPAYRSIGLGPIWNPAVGGPNDVTAIVLDSNLQEVDPPPPVVFALLGDYNHNLMVDSADYSVWRSAFTTPYAPDADGNFDGVIDAADYSVWRDHFGQSLAGTGYGSLAGGTLTFDASARAAPEPASGLIALVAGAGLLSVASRKGRSQHVSSAA